MTSMANTEADELIYAVMRIKAMALVRWVEDERVRRRSPGVVEEVRPPTTYRKLDREEELNLLERGWRCI